MKKNLFLVLAAIMLLATVNTMAQTNASQQNKSAESLATKKGMIKVTILYTAGEGKKLLTY